VFILFFVALVCCVARLSFIQFFRSSYLAGMARKQHNLFVELEPLRGTIYDCNLKPQAVNIPVDSLYASPQDLKPYEKDIIARQVAKVLNTDIAAVRDRLRKRKAFVWLARKISREQSDALRKLNLKGIGFIKESKRSYPNNYLESHVIGFAGLDNNGLEGLEAYYDSYLKGEAGWGIFLRDARQKKLDLWEKMVLPKDGYDIVLTIDSVIQYIAEREIDDAYVKSNAQGAMIIVMDPHTGRILAMANRPTYDLNAYRNVPKDRMRNRALCDLFEPGSVFKIVTAAGALQENVVKEEDPFFCENGEYRVGPHVLHDHHPNGLLTFKQVIGKSSNIGTVKVAQKAGPALVYAYAKLFGFGERLGVDMPGEIPGVLRDPKYWSKTSIAAVPIGQEVGVTALQLAAAISVIANGGQLMRPYILDEVRDKYGETIKKFSPTMIRKVLTVDTANRMRQILIGVVEEGTGRAARVEEFPAAGKTGTAQKIENGMYSHSKYYASFIGFAPADEPLVAIAVVIDEPRGYLRFGGEVAAPVFKKVARDVVRYLKMSRPAYEPALTHNN
jgi:cell division protein FtsI (penicillin-binding protein 3)